MVDLVCPLAQVTPVGSEPDKEMPPVLTEHDQLESVAQHTRKLLSAAFVSKFYKPYWDPDSSVVADMTLALHPSFKKLKYMQGMCLVAGEGDSVGGADGSTSAVQVRTRQGRVWKEIERLALKALEGKQGQQSDKSNGVGKVRKEPDDQVRSERPQKAAKYSAAPSKRQEALEVEALEYADFCGDASDGEVDPVDTRKAIVQAELGAWRSAPSLSYAEVSIFLHLLICHLRRAFLS